MDILLDEKTQKWLEEYTSKNPYFSFKDRSRAFGIVVKEAVKNFKEKVDKEEDLLNASSFLNNLTSAVGKSASSGKMLFSNRDTRDDYVEALVKQRRFINTLEYEGQKGIECMGMVWLLDNSLSDNELQLRDGEEITKFDLSEFEKR